MNATLLTSVAGLCPSQTVMEPPADASEGALEPPPPTWEAPALPASSYGEMPPLEGLKDSDEMGAEETETQGTVFAVTPTPKREGPR